MQPTLVTVTPPAAPQAVVGAQPAVTVAPSGVVGVVSPLPAPVIGPGATVAVTLGQVAVIGVAQGPPGAPGPAGPPGQYLEFDQASPSATWTIPHNFGVYPLVRVEDTTGRTLQAAVQDLDRNTVQVTFNAAVAGRAIVQG